MTNHHISVPKADLVLAINDLRLSGRYYSADLLKKALFSASVSAEPSDERTDSREQAKLDVITTWTDDDWNEVLSYADERTLESWRNAVRRHGAAPVSAVPNTQESTQAHQQQRTLANIKAFVACDASAITYQTLSQYRSALLRLLKEVKANE